MYSETLFASCLSFAKSQNFAHLILELVDILILDALTSLSSDQIGSLGRRFNFAQCITEFLHQCPHPYTARHIHLTPLASGRSGGLIVINANLLIPVIIPVKGYGRSTPPTRVVTNSNTILSDLERGEGCGAGHALYPLIPASFQWLLILLVGVQVHHRCRLFHSRS